jgi:hypothetical protein
MPKRKYYLFKQSANFDSLYSEKRICLNDMFKSGAARTYRGPRRSPRARS